MATYTIGTASGGYYNFRGANNPPYNYGSSFTVPNGKCWLVTDVSIQLAGNGATETVYGHIWNSAGTDYWQGSAVSVASDTSAPFSAKNLGDPGPTKLLNNISGANDTWYVGFSKDAADGINWDVVDGTSSTATGNTVNGNLSDFSPPTALARRLVGTFTYTEVTAPGTPSLTATPGNAQVSLSWTTPANGGVAISGYTLKRGTTTIYTGTGTSFTDTGRTNGTSYSYSVYATNGVGDGAADTASATPRTIPTAPTSFAASNSTFGQLALSWAAPSSNGGATISGYRLRTGTTLGAGTLLYEGTGTSYTHTGLSPYTDYSYNITAYNVAGESTDTTNATLTAKTMGGIARVWNGTDWTTQVALVKVCTNATPGSQVWTLAQARVWNGNEWKYGI